MKAPSQVKSLSVMDRHIAITGIYPPLGFVRVADAELGNGDYFGLYWPYGREQSAPVVCDMLHDQWSLEVAFSSVETFVEWLELNNYERGDKDVEGRNPIALRMEIVKPLLRDRPKEAIPLMRSICEDFPELAENWYTLATQLRRVGERDAANRAAVRAFVSNWVFGFPPNGTLRLLQTARGYFDDPVVERSNRLTMTYGGEKENPNYALLRECIDIYLDTEPVFGLLLNQNYGYMMNFETVSFKERNGFDKGQWLERHVALCQKHLGDSREKVS